VLKLRMNLRTLMSKEEPGPYEVIAEHGEVSVYRCEQGCLHLQIGNVNVRLEEDEFDDLTSVITEAAVRVGGDRLTTAKFGRVQ
jgi:hypothetical protein